jgi:hypothetical protein
MTERHGYGFTDSWPLIGSLVRKIVRLIIWRLVIPKLVTRDWRETSKRSFGKALLQTQEMNHAKYPIVTENGDRECRTWRASDNDSVK